MVAPAMQTYRYDSREQPPRFVGYEKKVLSGLNFSSMVAGLHRTAAGHGWIYVGGSVLDQERSCAKKATNRTNARLPLVNSAYIIRTIQVRRRTRCD